MRSHPDVEFDTLQCLGCMVITMNLSCTMGSKRIQSTSLYTNVNPKFTHDIPKINTAWGNHQPASNAQTSKKRGVSVGFTHTPDIVRLYVSLLPLRTCSSLRSESLKSSRSNKCTSHLSFAVVERCLAPSKTTTFALKAVGFAALNSITAQHCNLSPRHRLVKHDTEPAWRWHSVCNDCHSPREREPAPNLL